MTAAEIGKALTIVWPLVEMVVQYVRGERRTLPDTLPSRVKLEAAKARGAAKRAAKKN